MRMSLIVLPAFWSLAVLSTPQSHASEGAEGDMYKIGAVREYKVTQPRNGFIGSPTANIMSFPVGHPTKEEHFDKDYVRVEVVEKRALHDGQRVVLRVDKIDSEGHITKKGRFYVYVDISPKGTYVSGSSGLSARCGYDINTRCPFNCSRSPAIGFKEGKVDGYVFFRSRAVMYTRKTAETPSAFTVEVTRFDNPKAFEKDADRMVHWYGSEIADLAKAGFGATIRFREKQQWDKADDWLWKKMERFDAGGNIMMRCVLTKQTDVAPGGKEAREGAGGNRE